MMLPLKNLIRTAVHRAGISQQVHATHVTETTRAFLETALLPSLITQVHVVSFVDGVLKIACQSAVAAHEVKSVQEGIVEAVVSTIPTCQIRHVFIQIQFGDRQNPYDL